MRIELTMRTPAVSGAELSYGVILAHGKFPCRLKPLKSRNNFYFKNYKNFKDFERGIINFELQ